MKENNEVVSAKKDTKKLNESDRTIRERLAGIAIIALQNIHQQGG